MKTFLTAVMFLTAVTAVFGQAQFKVNPISREDGRNLFGIHEGQRIFATTPSVPTRSTTAIIVESAPNNNGRRVWLSTAESGNWAFLGVDSNDLVVFEQYIRTDINQPTPGLWQVVDTGKLQEALPQGGYSVARIVANRLDNNNQIVDSIPVGLEDPNDGVVTILSEGISGNNYAVTLKVSGGITANAVFALGMGYTTPSTIGVMGSVITLQYPINQYLPSYGVVTLAVRDNGNCHTVTFTRERPRLITNQNAPSN